MSSIAKAQVLAVSTAKPRLVEMNGVKIMTALVRDPSPVPLHFGPDGPEGNELAVHTESVYAFPFERYEYWRRDLEIDGDAWPLCFWGENITLTQFDEDKVRVGDLLRFSGGVVLEVTGPRIPCMKMAWRLGKPASVLNRLVQVGGLGFYLRVIEPGYIAAGETITSESPFPENITITELARLHDRAASTEVELLERVAATPRIANQSREMLLRTAEHMRDEGLTRQNRWTGWRPFIVAERREEVDGVVSLRLMPQDGLPVASYRAGQFLTVRVPQADGGDATRTWSLSDFGGVEDGYRLSVKRVEGGIGSAFICDTLREGHIVDARPPAGRFVLDRSPIRPVVLISAGIGVTPVVAMLRAHGESRFVLPVTWIHCTRNGDTHLFREEVERLLARDPQFESRIHYSQPRPEDREGLDYHASGRIDRESLKALVDQTSHYTLVGKQIELSGRSREFYVCGPRAFEENVRAWLVDLGVPDHFIRSETFEAAARAEGAAPSMESARIDFVRSGLTVEWQAEGGASLLDAAEAAGLSPDFGCRSGTCGACAAHVVEGRIEYAVPPGAEPPEGSILLCCARPASALLKVDL
ncbi:MOSC domain-containing protein [Novosphingobium sp.]|uniref:MOSC domain-containing protein n=1 Tax=Novosphingobium sp. TaxID=1874826 RepID=UPI0028A89AE6|nr:MOSC domain-containing protein [Novosphingobium sp.]